MSVLRLALTELLGLFVDDGSLVAGVAAWGIVVALVLKAQWVGPAGASIALAAGVAILLAENVLRSARKLSRR